MYVDRILEGRRMEILVLREKGKNPIKLGKGRNYIEE
jgi:hypothetical protein